jgi:hypothetical protein
MKLIDLHKEWMEEGKMSLGGLCYSLRIATNSCDCEELLTDFFEPTCNDRIKLHKEGCCLIYWASGLPENTINEERIYTPLRQTIVLFICAMIGEI